MENNTNNNPQANMPVVNTEPVPQIINQPAQQNITQVGGAVVSIDSLNFNQRRELIKAYIGKNSEKMFTYLKTVNPNLDGAPNEKLGKKYYGGFGLFLLTVFICPAYMFYRKMIAYSLYLLAVFSVVFIITDPFGYSVGILKYTPIVFVILFPYLYGSHINKKLKKIIKNNPGINFNQILELAKTQGGVSWGMGLLSIPIIIALAFLSSFLALFVAIFFS